MRDVPVPSSDADSNASDEVVERLSLAVLEQIRAAAGPRVEVLTNLVDKFEEVGLQRVRTMRSPSVDRAGIIAELHALKGTAGSFGAERLGRLAAQAEKALRAGGAEESWVDAVAREMDMSLAELREYLKKVSEETGPDASEPEGRVDA